MELTKFGAILKFAIELEQQVADLYEAAGAGQELAQSSAAARKRLSRLRTMQRELVNEMLLEPISGFEALTLSESGVDCTDPKRAGQQKAQIDQAVKQFYTLAAEKIATVAPGVGRAFKRMAEAL